MISIQTQEPFTKLDAGSSRPFEFLDDRLKNLDRMDDGRARRVERFLDCSGVRLDFLEVCAIDDLGSSAAGVGAGFQIVEAFEFLRAFCDDDFLGKNPS
jgi:hypothetical protein